MTYIKRHLEDAVLNMSRSFSAILVTGPRQSGKTTMLKKLAAQEGNNRGYVSLDDLNERSLAKEDPALFLQIHTLYTDRLYSLMKSNMHLNYLRILRFISTNITFPAVSG